MIAVSTRRVLLLIAQRESARLGTAGNDTPHSNSLSAGECMVVRVSEDPWNLCRHCGQRDALEQCVTYIVERREWEEVGAEWVRYWSVMQCRTCKRPTLREVGEWPGDPDHTTWTTFYPELVSSLTELPETVRGAWERRSWCAV